MTHPTDPFATPVPKTSKTGLARLAAAWTNSCAGLRAACGEAAFRLELIILVVVCPLALWVGRSGTERALLLSGWLLVMIVELVNTAIEAAIDRISLERHPLAKIAKDTGSAAVTLSIVLCALLWAGIGWDRWGT